MNSLFLPPKESGNAREELNKNLLSRDPDVGWVEAERREERGKR
jgi:hypothetical protein